MERTIFPELDTPSVLVDLDVMEGNIASMSRVATENGVKLRPHTKTHKCPYIANLQVNAGASGITVAKLGEAEVMLDQGLTDVLIAYPLVGLLKLRRLEELLRRYPHRVVSVSLDSPEAALELGRMGERIGRNIPVYLEVDTGFGRMGAPPGELTVKRGIEIARMAGVTLVGILTHAGHSYEAVSVKERKHVVHEQVERLLWVKGELSSTGVNVREVSVGSTPTATYEARSKGVTEIRPGTYVFYDMMQVEIGVCALEQCAVSVLVTVVARPTYDRAIVDGGTKTFTSDTNPGMKYPWGSLKGRWDAKLAWMTEEHGVLSVTSESKLRVGDRIEIVPAHVCGAINLHDEMYGYRNSRLERVLQICGRGRTR